MTSYDYAKSIVFEMNKGKIYIKQHHQDLKLIGTGRSACVFKIKDSEKVIKVFPPQFTHIAKEEIEIYQKIPHIPYFPAVYETGENFITMDFIKGNTLFSCLTKGIVIKERHIKEVDHILDLVRQAGLNPSDIHLRNIIITPDDHIKMIDVARFKQIKNCTQWRDLKNAYYRFYRHPLFPKKLPEGVLNGIAALYKRHLISMNVSAKKKVPNEY
ncbi:protein kinase family protein [Metabacillus sp. Hm71]|uniref:protein kinase family protein n=1 Tax=Metabacillus sp. Hm71 TaxID=3450743 RepID=UPI003F422188